MTHLFNLVFAAALNAAALELPVDFRRWTSSDGTFEYNEAGLLQIDIAKT